MRIVEDRAASGAELFSTGCALINPSPLVFAFRLPYDLRDVTDLATMDTAERAVRPAHLFDIVEAIIVGLELAGNVYEFHNARILAKCRVCVKYIIAA